MLTLSWALPLAGAILLLLVSNADGRRDAFIRWIAFAFSVAGPANVPPAALRAHFEDRVVLARVVNHL